MSAPSRGRGGGATRGTSATTPSNRGSNRAAFSNTSRGRGRGAALASTPGNINGGAGILQKLRTGTLQRNGDVTHTSGRGRGASARGQTSTSRARNNAARTSNTRQKQSPEVPSQAPAPVPTTSNFRDFTNQMSEKYNLLKPRRDAERKKAIKDGFLSDPDQKTSLDKAITPVGTCTEMCPQFERVERIVQNMVDKAEKVTHAAPSRDIPAEEKMVKRFRRSAAGYDEQLPSDIRTPETLRRTLDYLLDRVVDVERLASIHKFVWDRTRGIRNDFSIQQVSKLEDVKIAVNCYERIARFHILSMHQLSNPDNLHEGEHFEPQQEREQLNNTLLSLMYYYDDHRESISFPNEAEFRAYCILFERQSLHPDLEERMQSWPQVLLDNPKVQTAFKIYTAAGNSIFDQGPLRPFIPHSLAQSNSGKFWTLLASRKVSYIMACVAEITFNQVRFAALDALWRSGKSAPQGQQSRNQDWKMVELTNYLGFDDGEQTLEFVQEFGLGFGSTESGEQYLDMTALSSNALDKSSIPSQQIFSAGIVEEKRYRRTLVSVINGVNIATAIRQGSVVESPPDDNEMDTQDVSEDEQSLFIPETTTEQGPTISSVFGGGFNPEAPAFTPPGPATAQAVQEPLFGTTFGSSPGGQMPNSIFGTTSSASASQATTPNIQATTPSSFGVTPSSTAFGFKSQTGSTATQPSIPNVFKGFGATQEPVSATGFATNSIYPTFHLGNAPQDRSSQSPSQPTTHVGTNSFNTNTLPQFLPSQFGQNIAVNPGFGQNPSKDKAVASPLSTFFGQKLFGQQAKENDGKQKGEISAISQPASVFPSVSGPALTQSASSAPVQAEQSIGEPSRKIPSFFGTPNDVAQTQEKSAVTSPVTIIPQDPNPQKTPFVFTPQAPVSQPSQPAAVQTTAPVFNFDLSSKQSGSTNESSLFPTSQEGTATGTSGNVPAFKFASLGEVKARVQRSPSPSPSPALDAAAISTSADFRKQTTSQPSLTATPATSVPTAPAQSIAVQVDHTDLIRNTARLVLVQPQGLLEYLIGNHVSSVLVEVLKEFQKNQHDRVMTYVRSRFLSRKFFNLWKHSTQQSVLTKRAKQRRKLLAVAMRAEQQKQRRNEEELELIIAAAQETKQIQEHQRKLKEEADKRRRDEALLKQDIAQAGRVAGQKRKILTERDNKRSLSGTRMTNGISHKRSRTDGAISEPSLSVRSSSSPTAVHRRSAASSRFTQSFFGRSTSSQDLKQSTLSHKVDNTKSDYFKLKAMGIDPDTPIIPDTARSLALRQQKQDEERQISLSKIRARHASASPSSSLASSHLGSMPPPKRIPNTTVSAGMSVSHFTGSDAQTAVAVEDEFLKELRQAREAMSQNAEWFKTQTAEMEKDVKQGEGLRRSQQDQQSRHNHSTRSENPRTSINGLARANGYEYLPHVANPTHSLSRTEQRIRQTGAHGLATKPIGGGTPDYMPVAMSKRSAMRYSTNSRDDNQPQGQYNTMRTHIDSNDQHVPSSEHTTESSSSALKRLRGGESKSQLQLKARPVQASRIHSHSQNFFAALNDTKEEDDDEEPPVERGKYQRNLYGRGDEADIEDYDSEAEELEDEDEELNEEDKADAEDNQGYQRNNSHYLTSLPLEERVYDDDIGEDNDVEDEDGDGADYDDDDDGDDNYGYHPAFTYPTISRGTSGSTSASRSQSQSQSQSQNGPGASVDDAVVLSD